MGEFLIARSFRTQIAFVGIDRIVGVQYGGMQLRYFFFFVAFGATRGRGKVHIFCLFPIIFFS